MKVKQYLVFGLGRFGSSLARALCAQGQEALAVDSDQELVNQIAPHVTQALQLDATDEEALRSLGVKNFDAAVVAIGQNTRDSILICVLLKEMGIPYLIAKANDDPARQGASEDRRGSGGLSGAGHGRSAGPVPS